MKTLKEIYKGTAIGEMFQQELDSIQFKKLPKNTDIDIIQQIFESNLQVSNRYTYHSNEVFVFTSMTYLYDKDIYVVELSRPMTVAMHYILEDFAYSSGVSALKENLKKYYFETDTFTKKFIIYVGKELEYTPDPKRTALVEELEIFTNLLCGDIKFNKSFLARDLMKIGELQLLDKILMQSDIKAPKKSESRLRNTLKSIPWTMSVEIHHTTHQKKKFGLFQKLVVMMSKRPEESFFHVYQPELLEYINYFSATVQDKIMIATEELISANQHLLKQYPIKEDVAILLERRRLGLALSEPIKKNRFKL